MIETITNIDKLREIALDQHGLVTYQQAIDEGVSQPALSKLLSRNRLERAAYGVYRVPQVPVTQCTRFMLAVLWTGVPEACLSHDSALDAYEVCDINPTLIHITVAKKRRIAKQGGEGYVLHKQDLEQKQITWWEQIPITTLPVTIEQCVKGKVPTYLLRQAIERGAKIGKVLPEDKERLLELLEKRNG